VPTPRHSVSVAAAIVDDDGHIVVIKRRDNGHWEPPGGVLELDESILDGLAREVREETGLEIEPQRLTGADKNMTLGVVNLVFRARIVGGAEATSDETSQVARWTPAQVSERMAPAYAVRLLDALDSGPAAIRAHDGVRLLGS
jgi:ADP-ribose pyrophosphatase YjhB (NUDIX family)